MFQDAEGTVSSTSSLLAPPLVSVRSCHLFGNEFGKLGASLDHAIASKFLAQNAFVLSNCKTLSSHHTYKLVFVFHVTPPAHLVGAHIHGASGCEIKLEGGDGPAKISCAMNFPHSGKFDLIGITTNKIPYITLTVDNYQPSTDDGKMSIRFRFAPSDVGSVGDKLLDHEGSMDCILMTSTGVAVEFHRSVLAASSGYFDKLFYGQFAESKADAIDVQGNTQTWANIKSLMYKNCLDPSGMGKDVLIDTLETLYMYDLETFVPSVWGILSPIQNGATAVRSLRLAGLHRNTPMGLGAMAYIETNIAALMCNCEWIKAYADVLAEIGNVPVEFISK